MLREFHQYLKSKGYSDVHYQNIGLFLDWCKTNKVDVLHLTFDQLTQYRVFLQSYKGRYGNVITAGSFNNRVKAIKAFYLYLKESSQIDEKTYQIASKTSYMTLPKKQMTYFTKDEIANMLRDSLSFLRMPAVKVKAVIYTLFTTGLRKGEFCALKREDIDLKNCRLLVRTPNKTNRERVVFFPDSIAQYVKEYFESEAEEVNAFNMLPHTLTSLFKKMSKFLPYDKRMKVKDMRSSFGMLLAEQGITAEIAQGLLGHSNVNTTRDFYYKPDVRIAEKQYKEKINAQFNRKEDLTDDSK